MTTQHRYLTHAPGTAITAVQHGETMTRGTGFEALSFIHRQLDGLMDPLIMVDHFTMTEPTFAPHAHAGLSAVSVLFEDSTGSFRNRDSLGNDIELAPGDLSGLKGRPAPVRCRCPASPCCGSCRYSSKSKKPGMGVRREGGLGHGEVVRHDQRVHQPVELAMELAERFKARTPGHRLSVLDRGDWGAGSVSWVPLLRGHVFLLC